MTTYNVAATVVELVEADSPEEAIRKLHSALEDRGFQVYYDGDSDAFESEPGPNETGDVLR